MMDKDRVDRYGTLRVNPLQRLPLEVVHLIACHLETSGVIAMRQTDRWLYSWGSSETMGQLYRRGRADRRQKLLFLVLLERDGRPSPRQLQAGSPGVHSHRPFFAGRQMSSPGTNRECGGIFLCEHQLLTNDTYRRILEADTKPQDVGLWWWPRGGIAGEANERSLSYCCAGGKVRRWFARPDCVSFSRQFRRRLELHSTWPISQETLAGFAQVRSRGVEAVALPLPGQLRTRVCPHLRIQDCLVEFLARDIFSSAGTAWPESFRKRMDELNERMRCQHCPTTIWALFEASAFSLRACRWLGDGQADHPAWRAQMLTDSQTQPAGRL